MKMEQFVFMPDLTKFLFSPSRPDNSEMTSHDETPSLPACPICNRSSFETVLELERHVNVDHGDILSPEDKLEITGDLKMKVKIITLQNFFASRFENLCC
jgi:hypothetical protein